MASPSQTRSYLFFFFLQKRLVRTWWTRSLVINRRSPPRPAATATEFPFPTAKRPSPAPDGDECALAELAEQGNGVVDGEPGSRRGTAAEGSGHARHEWRGLRQGRLGRRHDRVGRRRGHDALAATEALERRTLKHVHHEIITAVAGRRCLDGRDHGDLLLLVDLVNATDAAHRRSWRHGTGTTAQCCCAFGFRNCYCAGVHPSVPSGMDARL